MTLPSEEHGSEVMPPPFGEENGAGGRPPAAPFFDVYSFLLGGLLGIVIGLLVGRFWLFRPAPLRLEVPTPMPLQPTPTPSPVQAYITGAVANPGVYTLPAGSRVASLVAAAGGFTDDADRSAVNLAQVVTDGMQVHVPREGERPAVTGTPRARRTPTPTVSFPLDINTASVEELQAIPGVGPTTARRIVEGRPYGEVDDLLRVRGIGPVTLEKIRPYVMVGE